MLEFLARRIGAIIHWYKKPYDNPDVRTFAPPPNWADEQAQKQRETDYWQKQWEDKQ
jgi:hypothetical protein